MIRIALFGAGRMSAAFAGQASISEDVGITAVVSRHAPDWLGEIPFTDRLDQLDNYPDVLVDFSLPEGTVQAARWCAQHKVALLSGVTGLNDGVQDTLSLAATETAVLWSANFSVGVNLLARLARSAVNALPQDLQVTIDDVHHVHKLDAPSGTALMLGREILESRPGLDSRLNYQSRREGEVIGQHSIRLEWQGEVLTLEHEALDRAIFARGALSAARWLSGRKAGRYTAEHWIAGLE